MLKCRAPNAGTLHTAILPAVVPRPSSPQSTRTVGLGSRFGATANREASTKNIGKKANYYAFPAQSEAGSDDLEQSLSKVESAAAPVVRTLLAGQYAITGEERANLLFFVAFFVTRIPQFRNRVENFIGEIGRKMLIMSAHHPEHFERSVREAHQARKSSRSKKSSH
jgi:Protein of unknown function (DUF4238)